MKYLYIFIIILFLIILLGVFEQKTIKKENFDDMINFSNESVIIGKSCVGDRGAFAARDIKIGEVVEVCPMIFDKRENISKGTIINDYVFSSDNSSEVGIAFGYCSMFNHNDDYNVGWTVHRDTKKIILTATKDIKQGDELFISYGDNYWSSRQKKSKGCVKINQ